MSEDDIPQAPEPPPELMEYQRAFEVYESGRRRLETALRLVQKNLKYNPSPPPTVRFHLPEERQSVTYRAKIGSGPGSLKFYVTPGLYPDGKLGEIFVVAEKEGSYVSGLLDAFAIVTSLALQHGVTLEKIVTKLRFSRFEPCGFTKHPKIGHATSVIDYIMRWLAYRFEPSIMEGFERPAGGP